MQGRSSGPGQQIGASAAVSASGYHRASDRLAARLASGRRKGEAASERDQVHFPQKTAPRSTRGALSPSTASTPSPTASSPSPSRCWCSRSPFRTRASACCRRCASSGPSSSATYISFAFIGGIWIAHSGVTKFMKSGDAESFSLNLLLLLFVGLLPFSTALMVTHLDGADAKPAVLIYGVNLLLASLVLSLLIRLPRAGTVAARRRHRRRLAAAHHAAALDVARAERPRDRRGARRPEGRGRPLPRRDHAAADHPVPRSAPASAPTECGVGSRRGPLGRCHVPPRSAEETRWQGRVRGTMRPWRA